MPTVPTPKHEVALELLDRAIELFLRGDSYYSAIHLGAAAEELLAVYAREIQVNPTENLKPPVDQMKAAIVAMSAPTSLKQAQELEKWAHDRMSHAKNSVKHKRGSKDDTVDFEATEEAYDVIDRAISTYIQLQSVLRLRHLPSISAFDAARK